MNQKQQAVSLETKKKNLNEISDKVLKKSEIVVKYRKPKSTITTILKNPEKIEAAYGVSQFEPAKKTYSYRKEFRN